MSAIDELKKIVSNQKTIRTSRLAPILKEIETMYIQQAKKIEKQKKLSIQQAERIGRQRKELEARKRK